jgi:hypothetical protein
MKGKNIKVEKDKKTERKKQRKKDLQFLNWFVQMIPTPQTFL